MSKFKEEIVQKELNNILQDHPLNKFNYQTKCDYVRGLVFFANVVENLFEVEKKYAISLMKNIRLDEELLKEYSLFEGDWLAYMNRLRAFDKDLKLNFFIEILVISFKGSKFNTTEQEIFDDYLDLLDLSENKDDIISISLALINKDKSLILPLYETKQELLNQFDYMFNIIDMDL